MERVIEVGLRYEGIPGLALGGYLCGLAAGAIGATAEVSLRRPVRVPATLTHEYGEASSVLRHQGEVVAEGRAYSSPFAQPPPVSLSDAQAAEATYAGLRVNLFPSCFACGPARSPGDGLRLFPGRVRQTEALACRWTPFPSSQADPTVPAEIVWAAVDCPGIWALVLATSPDSTERAVTGSIAAQLIHPVKAGQQYVVIAWPLGREGRKLYAGTAICSPDGEPQMMAKQTMILTEAGVPLGLNAWPALRAQESR